MQQSGYWRLVLSACTVKERCRIYMFTPLHLSFSSGEPSPTRREAVKKKTAEYLMRAEQIASQHLSSDMGQGSTQTVVIQITNFLLILTTLLIFNTNSRIH